MAIFHPSRLSWGSSPGSTVRSQSSPDSHASEEKCANKTSSKNAYTAKAMYGLCTKNAEPRATPATASQNMFFISRLRDYHAANRCELQWPHGPRAITHAPSP